MANSDIRMIIGKVTQPRGLDGTVGIYPLTDNPKRFKRLKKCLLVADGDPKTMHGQLVVIDKAIVSGTKVFLKFVGCDTRQDATLLKGLYLSIERDDAEILPPDHWYICDLVGCVVDDANYGLLGEVMDVLDHGPQSTLVVRKRGLKDVLIPLTKQNVPLVDIEAKRIETTVLDGLVELYRG